MPTKKHLIQLSLILLISQIIFNSCSENEKNLPPRKVLSINKFIDDYMSLTYFWNSEMPKISYRNEPDSEEYFYKLLKKPDDRWSFITDDIDALKAYFDGVQKTYGYSIQPYYLKPGSNQVVIFVEYVDKESPAEAAGLKRGDMFYKIDGQIITDKNYQTLLAKESMIITLGITDNKLNVIGLIPEISLSAVVMNIHPIVTSKILEISGHKIGYLAYNAFRENYDTALVNTFNRFKSENVTELVLDLRYNGGGSVSSALKLAGLIAPSSSFESVFIKEKWNSKMIAYFKQEYGNSDEIFILRIPGEENNIDLNRLFVLTTSNTASASEMVIYGLAPYMEIIQIGEKTHGKYYGSITIEDPKGKHTWAIQPIVMRSENATNNINYLDGLPPTKSLSDNEYNAQLGDPEEQFLKEAISRITTGAFTVSELKARGLVMNSIKGYKKKADPLRDIMLPSLPVKDYLIDDLLNKDVEF